MRKRLIWIVLLVFFAAAVTGTGYAYAYDDDDNDYGYVYDDDDDYDDDNDESYSDTDTDDDYSGDRVTIPHLIRFQGMLKDRTSEAPLDDTKTYTLTFKLYNADTGGSPLWEETQEDLTIVDGLLDVELGSVRPINLPFDRQYWLGVEVTDEGGPDGEMMPRFKLTSVPYAFQAER